MSIGSLAQSAAANKDKSAIPEHITTEKEYLNIKIDDIFQAWYTDGEA